MRITFLGTGTSQGVPVIACNCEVCASLDFRDKRLRTSIHIETGNKSIVIDTGPDFRQQMLRARIDHLDAVVFTHEHKDHTAGLDDVRAFNFRQGGDMPIYGTDRVIQQLKKEFGYAFAEKKYPGVPRIKTIEIRNEAFSVEGVNFLPVEVLHYKLPVFGFRVGDFTYITDANAIPAEEFEKIRNTRVLVLNALQKESHISHFTLEEALEIAREVNAEKTYFTHISHRLGTHHEISADLPANVELAYDGLTIEIDGA
ncbi:MBL fold metallo-hydrolase [Fulvivirga sedimenti]|uniref:MBL fold metallo-hydrolase n=1 Tax=Fulvivirga sedimenti TaxID=2879465 RepID=A0A9X1KVI2_9BACT|nr:MBL fold metallo-hydrolase [Fulvivirga sedimenti]